MSAQQQQRAMSPATARRLAALIVADAEQLQERAADRGVTAFVGRALQRERPNERFLQSTVRNLASANRRKDEREMWAAWEAEQQQRGRQRQRQKEDGGNGSSGGLRHSRSRSRDSSRSAGGRDGSPSRRRLDGSPSRRHIRRNSGSRSRDRSSRGRGRRRTSPSRSSSRSWSEVAQGEADQPENEAAGAAARVAGCVGVRSRSSGGATSSGSSSSSEGDRAGADAAHPDYAAAGEADAEDGTAAAEVSDAEKDEQLVQWLASSRAVRGRGSIGPRADMPGPFLQAPNDAQQLQQGVTKGPARPAWLPQQEPGSRMAPNAGFLRGVLRAQGVGAAAKISRQDDTHQQRKKKRRRRTISRSSGSSEGGSDSSSEGGSRKRRSSKHKKDKRKKEQKRSKPKKHKKEKRHKDDV